jgi:hypothetical protein
VGCTVKTNTPDIQTVDSDYSKTIHQEMKEDHKTKEARDQGVEKHSCQIELRGAHLNLVYYNGKQVLCAYSAGGTQGVLQRDLTTEEVQQANEALKVDLILMLNLRSPAGVAFQGGQMEKNHKNKSTGGSKPG